MTRLVPPKGGGGGGPGPAGGGGDAEDVDDWDEETATWSDYADVDGNGGGGRGGGGGASRFLPDDGAGGWMRDETTGEWTRVPRNPELGRFGPAIANSWIETDVTDAVVDVMLASDDADGDGIVEIGGRGGGWSSLALSLMISTDSEDGVIYASKEDWGGNGPYLELRFALGGVGVVIVRNDEGANNNATGPPSLSPAPTISPPPATHAPSFPPAAPLVRPFKPGVGGGIDEMTPKEEGERAETARAAANFRFSIRPSPPPIWKPICVFFVRRLFLISFFFHSPPAPLPPSR